MTVSGKVKCPFPSVMLHPLSCFIKMERTLPYVCPILPVMGTRIDCAFPLNLDNGMSFIFIYGLHKSVSLAAFHAPLPRCCVGISLPARQLNQKLMEDFFSLQNSFKFKIYINHLHFRSNLFKGWSFEPFGHPTCHVYSAMGKLAFESHRFVQNSRAERTF